MTITIYNRHTNKKTETYTNFYECRSAFQCFMDDVTRGPQGVFVYIDNILSGSGNREEHKQHLYALFDRLQKAGVIINPGKSFRSHLSYFSRAHNYN